MVFTNSNSSWKDINMFFEKFGMRGALLFKFVWLLLFVFSCFVCVFHIEVVQDHFQKKLVWNDSPLICFSCLYFTLLTFCSSWQQLSHELGKLIQEEDIFLIPFTYKINERWGYDCLFTSPLGFNWLLDWDTRMKILLILQEACVSAWGATTFCDSRRF